MGALDELDRRREEADRHRENSARLAQAFGKVTSQGQGTYEYDERIDFGLTFIEEPFPSCAHKMDRDEWARQLNVAYDVDTSPHMPAVSGYVTEWDLDERGFWIGCFVAVSVWFPLIDPLNPLPLVPIDAQPQIEHFFTFTGVAMKDVPTDLTD